MCWIREKMSCRWRQRATSGSAVMSHSVHKSVSSSSSNSIVSEVSLSSGAYFGNSCLWKRFYWKKWEFIQINLWVCDFKYHNYNQEDSFLKVLIGVNISWLLKLIFIMRNSTHVLKHSDGIKHCLKVSSLKTKVQVT